MNSDNNIPEKLKIPLVAWQQNNVWILFNVNSKLTYLFLNCSGVSIVNFERVNSGWERGVKTHYTQ